MPTHLSSLMTLLTMACSAGCLLTWMREDLRYVRPFGISEAESLMQRSAEGALHCTCEPTDPSEPANDRRRSCRACGCAIVSYDPARLYQKVSAEEIHEITWNLRKSGIDARSPRALAQPRPETSLVEAR